MTEMRTPGRRYWESHWHIRLAGFVAISMLSVSVWFTYSRVQQLQGPHNPHFSAHHCFDCHEGTEHDAAIDCFACHNESDRSLKDGARVALRKRSPDGECLHALRIEKIGNVRSPTALCLSCHRTAAGFVAMTNIQNNLYVEVDMGATHPIGLMPTLMARPKTLPLDHQTGAITCLTCHDQHAQDRRLKMLRYYYPGNGHPADFRPLCNDCHEAGWMPIKMRARQVQISER